MQMLFLMVAGHAYADFALQSGWHSSVKRPGNPHGYPWPVALACHSLIHGGIVALVTGMWWLGALESIVHGATDYIKGRGWIGAVTDQLIHLACKVLWCVLAMGVI